MTFSYQRNNEVLKYKVYNKDGTMPSGRYNLKFYHAEGRDIKVDKDIAFNLNDDVVDH